MKGIECCFDKADSEMSPSISIPVIGTLETRLNKSEFASHLIHQTANYAKKLKEDSVLRAVNFLIESEADYDAFEKALLSERLQVELTYEETKQIEKLTKSSDFGYALSENKCDELCYSAVYYGNDDNDRFTEVNVYSGTINCTEVDAIINMTALCREHQPQDITSNNSVISNKTENTRLNCTVYNACLFCSISTLEPLLASMDDDQITAVAIDLSNPEINAGDIRQFISMIQNFTMAKANKLDKMNCIIGNQEQAIEIATWMQQCINRSKCSDRWVIAKPCRQKNLGVKVFYLSQGQNQVEKMQSSLEKYFPPCKLHPIDEGEFGRIDQYCWQQIVLQFYCQFNIILFHQRQQRKVALYGLEENLLNAVTTLLKIDKNLDKENPSSERYKSCAKDYRWHVNVYKRKEKFDEKLNYKIENGYKNFLQDKQQKTISIDGNTKLIDYDNMTITIDHHQRYSIGKQCIKGLLP